MIAFWLHRRHGVPRSPKVTCSSPDAVLVLWCILLWIIGHDPLRGGLTRL